MIGAKYDAITVFFYTLSIMSYFDSVDFHM